jgi:glycerol-3-phosphate dehydrogenase
MPSRTAKAKRAVFGTPTVICRWRSAGTFARRYATAYGSRIERLLEGAQKLDDLGDDLGDGLYAAEVSYLIKNEWARTDDDILWRRTKLGLHVTDPTKARLRAWLGRNSLGETGGTAGKRLQA